MAQRKLKSVGPASSAVKRTVELASASATAVPSPALALHARLNARLAGAAVPQLPASQRIAIISLLASLSWACVGAGSYLIVH